MRNREFRQRYLRARRGGPGVSGGESTRGTRARARTHAKAPACDVCGAPMIEMHCKLICQRCGYRRDCSDP